MRPATVEAASDHRNVDLEVPFILDPTSEPPSNLIQKENDYLYF